MKKPLWLALALLLALTTAALYEHAALAGLAHRAVGLGIDIQVDFTRNVAHRLREAKNGGSPESLWIALGIAFTYGVAHALGPGHGKFVVTTYFLSHERRIWRGFLMGGQIAVMHVVSAIAIFLLAHYLAARFWNSTGDMPGLRAFSYASIALVGFYMLWRAIGHRRHDHAHDHAHEGACCGHGHGDHGRQGLLSFTVGVAPCSGAVLLLIFAFANDLVALGLLMTVAIAAGMAVTMIALGLAAILARGVVARRLARTGGSGPSRLGSLVELAGAALIVLFGLAMTVVSLAV